MAEFNSYFRTDKAGFRNIELQEQRNLNIERIFLATELSISSVLQKEQERREKREAKKAEKAAAAAAAEDDDDAVLQLRKLPAHR